MTNIDSFFNSIQSTLVTIGGAIIVIALIALGIKAILSFHKQGSLREVLSGAGVILVGALLIGGGVAIAGLFTSIAAGLK